jgi:hypothetical protein
MSYTEEIDGKQDRGTSAVRILEIVASNLESLVGETFARNLMQCTAHRNPHWESCFCRTRLVRISYRRYCHCQTEKVSNVGPYVCTKAVTVSDLHVPHSQVLGPCVSRPRAWGKAGWQLGHLSPRVRTEYTVSLPISLIAELFTSCRKRLLSVVGAYANALCKLCCCISRQSRGRLWRADAALERYKTERVDEALQEVAF